MTVTISTNDGVGDVAVKGHKVAVLLPMLPSIDTADNYVIPHQANLLHVRVTNTEGHEVTIGL